MSGEFGAAYKLTFDQARLDALLRSSAGPVAADLEKRAQRVENAAKRNAPVDTGRLRSSITHSVNVDGTGLFAEIGTNVEYAVYQEFGTAFQPGTPFLIPALEEVLRNG
jgi:HK97 gp10 family phage protein